MKDKEEKTVEICGGHVAESYEEMKKRLKSND